MNEEAISPKTSLEERKEEEKNGKSDLDSGTCPGIPCCRKQWEETIKQIEN